MKKSHHFPFGQPLKKVQQTDRSPKQVFVLGVYASAVHARWVGPDGRQKVAALAVASEPEIFWRGEDAGEIIRKIHIPKELGILTVPNNRNLNGPSGRALDEYFLKPLGYDRSSAWLCDLLPYSRVNKKQRAAIDEKYNPEIAKHNLPPATIPDFDKAELNSAERRNEILDELEASGAHTLILLGDLPIKWFLKFHDKRFSKLSAFGIEPGEYGRPHELTINKRNYQVIPLCHPRQAGRLGASNTRWGVLHDQWINRASLNE